jgi:hypothetical protein
MSNFGRTGRTWATSDFYGFFFLSLVPQNLHKAIFKNQKKNQQIVIVIILLYAKTWWTCGCRSEGGTNKTELYLISGRNSYRRKVWVWQPTTASLINYPNKFQHKTYFILISKWLVLYRTSVLSKNASALSSRLRETALTKHSYN